MQNEYFATPHSNNTKGVKQIDTFEISQPVYYREKQSKKKYIEGPGYNRRVLIQANEGRGPETNH